MLKARSLSFRNGNHRKDFGFRSLSASVGFITRFI